MEGAPAPARAFPYAASLAPMLWVLVALSTVELLVVHLMVALLWSKGAALVLSAAALAGMAWLVALIRSLRRRPVLVSAAGLVWRVGLLRRIDVPIDAVAGPVAVPDREGLRARDVANLALISHPNVAVALRRPVPGGRRGPVRLLAHRLDDPAAFLGALARAAPPQAGDAMLGARP